MELNHPFAHSCGQAGIRSVGKYEILKRIGTGSTCDVFLGRDPFIDRRVAIKIAHTDQVDSTANGDDFRTSFFAEAQAAGTLRHPNITAIYDAGIVDNLYYIAMEYIPGGATLEQFTHPCSLLPIDVVAGIVYQCAMALDYAHKVGIVHRNIRPKNILLTDRYDPKISDFGVPIVTTAAGKEAAPELQSLKYFAPEQLQNHTPSANSDLFALGVVLYELLTGQHPFTDDPSNVSCARIRTNILEALPQALRQVRADLPDILQAIINRALAKKPGRRYQAGSDMAGDLSLIADFINDDVGKVPRQQRFAILRTTIFFKEFTDAHLRELIDIGEWLFFESGTALIQEGETENSLYIVLSGKVCVSKHETRLVELGTGDCFGEMGFVSGRERTATITTLAPVTLFRLKPSAINRLPIDCQVSFQRQFLQALIARLDRANHQFITTRSEAPAIHPRG